MDVIACPCPDRGFLGYFSLVLGTSNNNVSGSRFDPHESCPHEGLLLLLQSGVGSQLANGSTAFIWKLHCIWLKGLWQHQITVMIQASGGYVHITENNLAIGDVMVLASRFHSATLGASWVFGFLAVADARLVFQYLFCIFNSTQGFVIFWLYCYRDPRVRQKWIKCCGCESPRRDETHDMSTPKGRADKSSVYQETKLTEIEESE